MVLLELVPEEFATFVQLSAALVAAVEGQLFAKPTDLDVYREIL